MQLHPVIKTLPARNVPRFGDPVKSLKQQNLNDWTDSTNPSVMRAFINRFPPGSKMLATLFPGGPLLVCDVTYNNGKRLVLENPYSRFVPLYKVTPDHTVIRNLPPLILPEDLEWKKNREQNEAKLAHLIELNRAVLKNPRTNAQQVWLEQFNNTVDKALKTNPSIPYWAIPNRRNIHQPIGFTQEGELVLVKNPKWTPHTLSSLKHLDGYQINRSLPKLLWPQVEKQEKGYQVKILTALPADLTPVTSDFTGENAAFIPRIPTDN